VILENPSGFFLAIGEHMKNQDYTCNECGCAFVSMASPVDRIVKCPHGHVTTLPPDGEVVADLIAPEFSVTMLGSKGKDRAQFIAISFTELVNQISPLVADPYYKQLMKNKLEEACFLAKKGMTIDPSNWK
jgi:hypothetical protein